MVSISTLKDIGPKLLPFFESMVIFFILYPFKAESSVLCVITKCIPIAALFIFVLSYGINFKFEYSYSRRICTGLVFSMIGDACLVYKEDYFIFGIASFGIAHLIYLSAFGIKPFNLRLAWALTGCAIMASALYVPHIKSYVLKVAVPIYMLLLLSMLWRAISRLDLFSTPSTNTTNSLTSASSTSQLTPSSTTAANEWSWTKKCCTLGALFFVISDSILSFDLFICNIPYSHPMVMLTYYAAQLGIALSVIDSLGSHEVNRSVIQHHDLLNGVRRLVAFAKSSWAEDSIKLVDEPPSTTQTTTTTAKISHSEKNKHS